MIEQNEIKKLIKQGFDLELLSFELEIPIQQIYKYKREIWEEQHGIVRRSTKQKKEPQEQVSKIELMREKYQAALKPKNTGVIVEEKIPSKEENDEINQVIEQIKLELQQMKDAILDEEKKKSAANIIANIKKIEEYPMFIEQIDEIKTAVFDDELSNLNLTTKSSLFRSIPQTRVAIVRKLVDLINIKLQKVNNVSQVEELHKRISYSIQRDYPLITGSTVIALNNKKTEIIISNNLNRFKNDIPVGIVNIMQYISKGTLKKEYANETIRVEAEKRLQTKTKNNLKFLLPTVEQEKKQILFQIKSELTQNYTKFPIIEPERAMVCLQEIDGMRLTDSMEVVVNNLICRKDLEQAKNICDQFLDKKYDDNIRHFAKDLKYKIRIAEIGEMVLKALDKKGTIEEENKCFDMIKSGLSSITVKKSSILLGTSEDGRNITLYDIWPEKEEKLR